MSTAKACLFSLDYLHARFTYLPKARRAGKVVVFDRYMHDLLADPRRYRFGAPLWIWRIACCFAPKPDCTVLIDVPPAVAVERKGELSLEQAERLRARYRQLADRYNWTVVDGTKSPETIAQTIFDQLTIEQQHCA